MRQHIVLASHLKTAKDVDDLIFAQQKGLAVQKPCKPTSLLWSYSYDAKLPVEAKARFEKYVETEVPNLAKLVVLKLSEMELSPFQHYLRLLDELKKIKDEENWIFLPRPGDLWHPAFLDTFDGAFQIMTKEQQKATVAIRSLAHSEGKADPKKHSVDHMLVDEKLNAYLMIFKSGSRAQVTDFSFQAHLLISFLEESTAGLLKHPWCAIAFVAYVRCYGLGQCQSLCYEPQAGNWLYYRFRGQDPLISSSSLQPSTTTKKTLHIAKEVENEVGDGVSEAYLDERTQKNVQAVIELMKKTAAGRDSVTIMNAICEAGGLEHILATNLVFMETLILDAGSLEFVPSIVEELVVKQLQGLDARNLCPKFKNLFYNNLKVLVQSTAELIINQIQ